MTFVWHYLSARTSQFWADSHVQQQLVATEICEAADSLRQARHINIKSRPDALAACLKEAPLDIFVVADMECEIDKDDLIGAFDQAFAEFPGPASVGTIGIWAVLVKPGKDRFLTFKENGEPPIDGTPSEYLPKTDEHLMFCGVADDGESAERALGIQW